MRFGLISVVLTSLFIIAGVCHAQNPNLKDLIKHYKSQKTEEPVNVYHDTVSGVLQIILIRHGEPDLDKKGWRNRDGAVQFMKDYDASIVVPFCKDPLNLKNTPLDTVQHSSLPRAKHTAMLAFGDQMILEKDHDYREFESKTMKWCNIKLPLQFWTLGSRGLWFMGFNDENIESFREAKIRVENNANKLSDLAKRNGMVILVAHGLHNMYVVKSLRHMGWKKVYDNGDGYLSVKILALMPGSD